MSFTEGIKRERDFILEVRNLKVWFPVRGLTSIFARSKKYLRAVDGVSFNLHKGEVLSVVGESGAGKTTLGLTIVGVYKPTEGEVFFKGINIHNTNKKTSLLLKRKIQMIFQDPFESLPPHMTVFDIIKEGIDVHKLADSTSEKIKLISTALENVGLTPPEDFFKKYPHQLSGGQRQRVSIASILALKPELIIADEPISMIDASLRGSILSLMMKLKRDFDLTYVFILHDLAIARCISTHIAVMYLGQVVEAGKTNEIIKEPLHPYTKALLSAAPSLRKISRRKKISLKGEIPSPIDLPSGCRFSTRCPFAFNNCRKNEPVLIETKQEHYVRCLMYQPMV
jgi:peptide/nickel transport system ATP-binding protein